MAAVKAAGAQAGGTTPHTPDPVGLPAVPADLSSIPADVIAQVITDLFGPDDERARWWRSGWEAHQRQVDQTGETLTPRQKAALERLRDPFPASMIEKLPKVSCSACLAVARDKTVSGRACARHTEVRCQVCDSYSISEAHIHLDYIGHANATNRLLEADPGWTWEPVSRTPEGLPLIDGLGGMWIKLTVCGMTRYGYGDATGRNGATSAVKEIIGDAIRNAGMRFGMALDLWSKADLHMEPPCPAEPFLARIKDGKVWNSPEWLAGVRREAAAADQLGYEVPGGGGTTLADVIDGQLERLAERERSYAEARLQLEEAKQAAEDAERARRAEEKEEAAAAAQERQRALEEFKAQVAAGWSNVEHCEQNLTEATERGFLLEWTSGAGNRRYQIGALLEERIVALRQHHRAPSGTGAVGQAAGARRDDSREEWPG